MIYLSNIYQAVNNWMLPHPITQIPLAKRMQDETTSIHTEVENHPFIQKLMNNELTIQEYKQYLTDLLVIYETLENELKNYCHHTTIQPFYFENLFRSSFIKKDLSQSLFQSNEVCQPTNSALEYCEHLQNLTKDNPTFLLAHFYVRYLGDLSGGEFIKQSIQKQWPTATHFYDFSLLIKEFRGVYSFKQYFRQKINELNMDHQQANKLIEEVFYAYHHTRKVLDSICWSN